MQYYVAYFGVPLIVTINKGVILSVEFAEGSEYSRINNTDTSLLNDLWTFAKGDHSALRFSLDKAPLNTKPILLKALEIPFGKVVSYGELSRAVFGSSRYSRFVGFAMGHNPVPVIVPCHRVVFSDGSFKGFSAPFSIKERLLMREGVNLMRRVTDYKGVNNHNAKIDKTFFTHF